MFDVFVLPEIYEVTIVSYVVNFRALCSKFLLFIFRSSFRN